MTLVEYAEHELNLLLEKATEKEDKECQTLINNHILELIKIFSQRPHKGITVWYTFNMVKSLLNFNPIIPLTGDDDEWSEPIGDIGQQNKRCDRVFRNNYDNSTAHYSNGKIFSSDGGITWYSNKNSDVMIKFPYNPPNKPKAVYLDETGTFEISGVDIITLRDKKDKEYNTTKMSC